MIPTADFIDEGLHNKAAQLFIVVDTKISLENNYGNPVTHEHVLFQSSKSMQVTFVRKRERPATQSSSSSTT